MFRAGIFNQPKDDDPEFKHQNQAELWCKEQGKKDSCEAYAVWDKWDATVYLYLDFEEFEPRN